VENAPAPKHSRSPAPSRLISSLPSTKHTGAAIRVGKKAGFEGGTSSRTLRHDPDLDNRLGQEVLGVAGHPRGKRCSARYSPPLAQYPATQPVVAAPLARQRPLASPVPGPDSRKPQEEERRTDMNRLAGLKPDFGPRGSDARLRLMSKFAPVSRGGSPRQCALVRRIRRGRRGLIGKRHRWQPPYFGQMA